MDITLPSLFFFDPEDEAEREREVHRLTDKQEEKDKALRCASCGRVITHQDDRIAVQGSHEHRFTNPHRLEFHIGCFRQAVGCTQMGDKTKEWTWFAGYTWQIALCGQCRAHLGWRFDSPESSFYGLILNRLTSRAQAG